MLAEVSEKIKIFILLIANYTTDLFVKFSVRTIILCFCNLRGASYSIQLFLYRVISNQIVRNNQVTVAFLHISKLV
jgi:hypothetical protein